MVTFPIDLHLGPVTIPSHLLFEVFAFFFGFQYYIYLRNKSKDQDKIGENKRYIIIIGAIVGALLGSRLLAALERPELFLNPPNLLFYYSAKTVVGGLLGGIIGVEITKKILKEKHSSGDLFTYPLILAMILGRIGCLLTGVMDATVGIATNLPWAFDQGDGIARHPTSLYEILFLLLLWGFIWYLENRNKQMVELKDGSKFKIFILGYLIFRFLIEFVKPVEYYVFGISAIQTAALLGVIYYLYIIVRDGLFEHKVIITKKNKGN